MIDFNAPLPDRGRPPVRIARPKAGEVIRGWILSARPVSVILHWDGERSVPHETPREQCPRCRAGMPLKGQYLYLAGQRKDTQADVLWEFTPQACERCWDWIDPDRSPILTGCSIAVARPAGRPRATLSVLIGPPPAGGVRCPVWSAAEALQAIWEGPLWSRAHLYDERPDGSETLETGA